MNFECETMKLHLKDKNDKNPIDVKNLKFLIILRGKDLLTTEMQYTLVDIKYSLNFCKYIIYKKIPEIK